MSLPCAKFVQFEAVLSAYFALFSIMSKIGELSYFARNMLICKDCPGRESNPHDLAVSGF